MHDTRKAPETRSYLADRAIVVKQGADAYVVMTDGHIVQRNEAGDPAEIIAFQKYAIDLEQFEKKEEEKNDFKPRERYFGELVNPEPDSSYFKTNPGQFRAELHERFANPLYPIAFVLIALASVGQAQSTRQGRAERMVGGFLMATGSRFAGLAVNNLAVISPLAVIGLYGIPLLTCLLALFAVRSGARPRRRFSIVESATDRLIPYVQSLREMPAHALRPFSRSRGVKR
jgi:lipopolysaccharide export system permease protein